MFRSYAKSLLLASVGSLVLSCTSKDTEFTFNKKPVTSIESKNGNMIVHFGDHTTQSFSQQQVETLLKEKKIAENIYQLFTQKVKDAALQKQRLKATGKADKQPYPYKLNGRDVHYVEFKNSKFIIHMADKDIHSFL